MRPYERNINFGGAEKKKKYSNFIIADENVQMSIHFINTFYSENKVGKSFRTRSPR